MRAVWAARVRNGPCVQPCGWVQGWNRCREGRHGAGQQYEGVALGNRAGTRFKEAVRVRRRKLVRLDSLVAQVLSVGTRLLWTRCDNGWLT